MEATADPSLLSAELEAEDGDGEALRRLLQVNRDELKPSPAAPSRTVTPQPGLCIKTRAGGAKAFINVCHSQEVPPPPPLPPAGLRSLLQGPPEAAEAFRIPMSLGEPRGELDRGGSLCTAFDVVINSDFFQTLKAEPLYLELFLTVAMEGLGEKYGVELELSGWKLLRHRRCLGTPRAQLIRSCPRIQELQGPPQDPPPGPPPVPPQFVLLALPSPRCPQLLEARVLLPRVASGGALWVGLSSEQLVLSGASGGPPLLQLGLPHPPDPAHCHAHFHCRTKVLTVRMPLVATP